MNRHHFVNNLRRAFGLKPKYAVRGLVDELTRKKLRATVPEELLNYYDVGIEHGMYHEEALMNAQRCWGNKAVQALAEDFDSSEPKPEPEPEPKPEPKPYQIVVNFGTKVTYFDCSRPESAIKVLEGLLVTGIVYSTNSTMIVSRKNMTSVEVRPPLEEEDWKAFPDILAKVNQTLGTF